MRRFANMFIRKRDGARYYCDQRPVVWPGHAKLGDCYYLVPVWDGRSHYKSIAAFNREYENEDGTAIVVRQEGN